VNLTKIAISRHLVVVMAVIAAVLAGVLAYTSMRVELDPDVTFPTITVSTVYPGAGPEEIANLVTKPLEDTISGIANVREVSSTSREGASSIVIMFAFGTNLDAALNDVKSRVDAISDRLPVDALRPTISRFDTSSKAVLTLAVTSSKQTSERLRNLLDTRLRDRFAQINGVAEVTVQGGDVREIQIQLDKDKLIAYGIGISDVTRLVQSATLNVPRGTVTTDETQCSLRVMGEWKSVDDVKASVLSLPDSEPNVRVRLEELATITDGIEERMNYARLNGEDTILLALQKTRDGNAVQITRDADGVISQIRSAYPDIQMLKTYEDAREISHSLADLNFTLFFGIVLVSLVVFIFLHDLRGTVIVALAIPVCMAAAVAVAHLVGFSINSMTMLALILAVGVLVDDAIVVLENIYRYLKMGMEPQEAAIKGRSEIGLAAIAITLADVVVFLPTAFMGGIVGQFFKPLALTYSITVLFSMLVSFTLTPMLAARWYKAGEDLEHPQGRFARWFEGQFRVLAFTYGRMLRWSLYHRWFVFLLGNSALVAIVVFIIGGEQGVATPRSALEAGIPLFLIATAIGGIVFLGHLLQKRFRPKYIGYGALFGLIFPLAALAGGLFAHWKGEALFAFEFLPPVDKAQININVKLPSDASLKATQRVVSRIEQTVLQDPNVKYVTSSVGTQDGGGAGEGNTGANYALVSATLYEKGAILDKLPWKHQEEPLRWVTDTSVAANLLKAVGRIPGAEIKVSANQSDFGSPIQLSLTSDNPVLLTETARNIKGRLLAGAIPGIINPDVSTTLGKPELRTHPDRERLADAGLTVGDIGTTLRTLYQGDDSVRYRVDGQEYKVRVQMNLKEKNNPALLEEVPVGFHQGQPIFLASVADLRVEPAVDQILRRDRKQEVQLTADLLPGYDSGSVQEVLDQWIVKEKVLPPGVKTNPLGAAQSQEEELGGLALAFGIGITLVYMLLAALYNNYLYPFIIQLAQPQAITGALLAVVLADSTFNVVGFVGIITLVGLVGKNAILLVDYTNTLRARGHSRHLAIIEAGPTRLRPILMTTFALIVGTLPIALAIGRGSEFRASIGIIIVGGMALSTLLTLFVIPCSYTIFDDLSDRFGSKRRADSQAVL
jgi:HAE1 family hydrophobic/amphiphilic exporter-1